MRWYEVALRGENFLLNLTGEPELLGFRVIHYVKAASEEEAVRCARIGICPARCSTPRKTPPA